MIKYTIELTEQQIAIMEETLQTCIRHAKALLASMSVERVQELGGEVNTETESTLADFRRREQTKIKEYGKIIDILKGETCLPTKNDSSS